MYKNKFEHSLTFISHFAIDTIYMYTVVLCTFNQKCGGKHRFWFHWNKNKNLCMRTGWCVFFSLNFFHQYKGVGFSCHSERGMGTFFFSLSQTLNIELINFCSFEREFFFLFFNTERWIFFFFLFFFFYNQRDGYVFFDRISAWLEMKIDF